MITVGCAKSLTALEVLSAEKLRAYAFHYVRQLFKVHNLSAVVTPTSAVPPPILTEAARECGENNIHLMSQMMKFIFLANLIGTPGYSVPIGYTQFTADSPPLPIGLHLMGTHWSEHVLLRIASALDSEYASSRILPLYFVDMFPKTVVYATWKRSRNGGVVVDDDDNEEREEGDRVESMNEEF